MGFLPWDSSLPGRTGGPRPRRLEAERKATPAPRGRWPLQQPAADSTRPPPFHLRLAAPASSRTGRVPACPTTVQAAAAAPAGPQAIAYKHAKPRKTRLFSHLQALHIAAACKNTIPKHTGLDFACNNMQAGRAPEWSRTGEWRENRALSPHASPLPTVPQDIRSCVHLIANSHENAIFVDLDQVLSIIACNCMQYMTNAGEHHDQCRTERFDHPRRA